MLRNNCKDHTDSATVDELRQIRDTRELPARMAAILDSAAAEYEKSRKVAIGQRLPLKIAVYASEISKLCDEYGNRMLDMALSIYIDNGLGRPKISDLQFLLSLWLRLAAAAELRKSFPEEYGRWVSVHAYAFSSATCSTHPTLTTAPADRRRRYSTRRKRWKSRQMRNAQATANDLTQFRRCSFTRQLGQENKSTVRTYLQPATARLSIWRQTSMSFRKPLSFLVCLLLALAPARAGNITGKLSTPTTHAKLAVYPMLVWLILGRMMQLDAFWVNVGVLIACLPSAGNIYVLAQRYDADPQQVSAAILLSTIVSVVSFPCVAWLALD